MTSTSSPTPVLPYETPPVDPDTELKQQTGPRTLVFILTWIAYASLYFGRKGFPVVKSTLENTLGISRTTLGHIDTG